MLRTAIASAVLAIATIGSAQAVNVTSVTATAGTNNDLSKVIDGDFALGTWYTYE